MSKLKRFGLGVLIGLPLAFYVWFAWSSVFVMPAARLSELLLTSLWPDVFHGMQQIDHTLIAEVLATVQGRAAILSVEINPLLYSYGMPLFFGLIMATPIPGRRQVALLAIGLPMLVLFQAWGVSFRALHTVQFQLQQYDVAALGLNAELIALGRQMGYLILPGVVPVVIWILGNRPFIQQLVAIDGEASPSEDSDEVRQD